jgi:hypothetical protein
MRILLDAKDVINLVEHSDPISLSEFDAYLRRHYAELALTFTVVREFVGPLAFKGNFLDLRPSLQAIERLPLAYLREAPIFAEEIKAALHAFGTGADPARIDPYVRRWDYTFAWPGPPAAEIFVDFRLDEIVYGVYRKSPHVFKPYAEAGRKLREQFAAERQLPGTVRKSLRDNFADSVRRHAIQWRIDWGSTDIEALGHCIYDDPSRCPGLRLSYDAYHELLANLGDDPKDSDIPDFAHLNAIPYVDLATLDRPMIHYLAAVVRKLQGQGLQTDYARYVYPSLSCLLNGVP